MRYELALPTVTRLLRSHLVAGEAKTARANVPVRSKAEPVIERVRSRAAPNLPIVDDPFVVTGQQLVIDGSFEGAEDVRVWLGPVEISPAPEDVTETRIAVVVPPTVPAGVHRLEVGCSTSPRPPGAGARVGTSSAATFVLQPRLDPRGVAVADGYITLFVSPGIRGTQFVWLLLNEWEPAVEGRRPPRAYRLRLPPQTGEWEAHAWDRDEIAVPIADVEPGEYLVRLQVDGAKSPLGTVDGRFAFPRITVP